MINIIDQTAFWNEYSKKLRLRTLSEVAGVEEIIRNVAQRGDEAVREYTAKFDGVELGESLRLSQDSIDEYAAQCDPAVQKALEAEVQ